MTDIELGHHDVMFKSIYPDLRSNNFSIFIGMGNPKLFHLAKQKTYQKIPNSISP